MKINSSFSSMAQCTALMRIDKSTEEAHVPFFSADFFFLVVPIEFGRKWGGRTDVRQRQNQLRWPQKLYTVHSRGSRYDDDEKTNNRTLS